MKWLKRIGGGLAALSAVLTAAIVATAQTGDVVYVWKPQTVALDTQAKRDAATAALVSVWPGTVLAEVEAMSVTQDDIDLLYRPSMKLCEAAASLTDDEYYDLRAAGRLSPGATEHCYTVDGGPITNAAPWDAFLGLWGRAMIDAHTFEIRGGSPPKLIVQPKKVANKATFRADDEAGNVSHIIGEVQ